MQKVNFTKVRETHIQFYEVSLEGGDAKPSFYYVCLKAGEAKSSFSDVFSMAGKATMQFYIDFLRKTIAGRPFEGTTGTIRDRIGTGIN